MKVAQVAGWTFVRMQANSGPHIDNAVRGAWDERRDNQDIRVRPWQGGMHACMRLQESSGNNSCSRKGELHRTWRTF
jgi:hypothetical protein